MLQESFLPWHHKEKTGVRNYGIQIQMPREEDQKAAYSMKIQYLI